MSADNLRAVTVTVYAEDAERVRTTATNLVIGTAFELAGVEPGPVTGTATCHLRLRAPHLVTGSGNLVELLFRFQRYFEIHAAHRVVNVPAEVAA